MPFVWCWVILNLSLWCAKAHPIKDCLAHFSAPYGRGLEVVVGAGAAVIACGGVIQMVDRSMSYVRHLWLRQYFMHFDNQRMFLALGNKLDMSVQDVK